MRAVVRLPYVDILTHEYKAKGQTVNLSKERFAELSYQGFVEKKVRKNVR